MLHVSTANEVPVILASQPWVTSEICLHHIFFSVDDYDRLGTLIQMNPSLKTKHDCEELWKALLNGSIQVIATDHAPHLLEEKRAPYPKSPSGLPAVENSLALMLDQVNQGKCSLEQVASWMSDAPARVWGLVGKGRIATDYDADLVLVDMQLKKTIEDAKQWTKCKWSPWNGVTLQGWPVQTWVNGQTVYRNGEMLDEVRGRRVRCDHARGGFFATPDGIGT